MISSISTWSYFFKDNCLREFSFDVGEVDKSLVAATFRLIFDELLGEVEGEVFVEEEGEFGFEEEEELGDKVELGEEVETVGNEIVEDCKGTALNFVADEELKGIGVEKFWMWEWLFKDKLFWSDDDCMGKGSGSSWLLDISEEAAAVAAVEVAEDEFKQVSLLFGITILNSMRKR